MSKQYKLTDTFHVIWHEHKAHRPAERHEKLMTLAEAKKLLRQDGIELVASAPSLPAKTARKHAKFGSRVR